MVRSVAVVGGGAVGLTASVELASRGASVTLFEADKLGSGATGRAAGICYDAYVDARDGRFAADSLERFRELGVVTERPYLWFARDETTGAAIESHVEGMQAAGRNVSLLDSDEVAGRFPGLAAGEMTTAAVATNAGWADTERYVELLSERARDAGVEIQTETPAAVPEPGLVEAGGTNHSFDAVLVAAGASTARVLAGTEFEPAVGCYRTQLLRVTASRAVADQLPMFYDASEEYYARPTGNGLLAGDGSAMYDGPPAEYDRSTDEQFRTDRLAALGDRIESQFDLAGSWAGLCTATPDGDPLLGECLPDLYVATGFCGHGFMRAPAIGDAVADVILGDGRIRGFEPTRFDGTEPIELPVGVTE